MSLSDFWAGKTAEQVNKEKELIEKRRLEADFKDRWKESERVLGILRSTGGLPTELNKGGLKN